MRRKDKEITDRNAIESIIAKSRICRLAMVDDAGPYIVPLCFGFRNNTLYFHSAAEGKKLDAREVGDLLVTSGLGGMFPAGYPVAIVTTVNRIPQAPFADVTARPVAALDRVREVMVSWSAANVDSPAPETSDE